MKAFDEGFVASEMLFEVISSLELYAGHWPTWVSLVNDLMHNTRLSPFKPSANELSR
jgi:hypothetical protein